MRRFFFFSNKNENYENIQWKKGATEKKVREKRE
jgi:hypothetical protein